MYKIYAFDTEDDGKGGFILGAVTDGEAVWFFQSADSMREWMESCPDPVNSRFIAHNLEYDLGNLYRSDYGRLRPKWNRSRLLWSEVHGSRIRYFNSFCHAPIALREMGEIIGLKKLEFPYWKIRSVATNRLKTYLSRDVEILWRFMNRLQSLYEELGTSLAPTAPGAAMRLFRAWTPDYCSKKYDEELINRLKPSYYGGRTEAFYFGEWNRIFHYSDVHSMYPTQMRGDFPNFHIWKNRPPEEGECGVIEATVRAPEDFLPVLPFRGEERLTFPAGTFRGRWTREEFDYALSCGVCVEKIHAGVTFPINAGPVLRTYVDRLYALRQRATNRFEKWLYKLLMNSLYGKFASSPTIWTLISEDEYIDRTSGPVSRSCACGARKVWDGTLYLVMERSGYPIYTNYIWPALITSRARIMLHRTAKAVLNTRGKVFYTDTDSIIYSGSKIPSSDCMGGWETETHQPPETLEIRGPKMYRIGSKYVVKGVPAVGVDEYGNATTPSRDFFEKGVARFRRPVRMREALKNRTAKKSTLPGEFGIPNFWVDVERIFGDHDQKRIRKKNGWTTPQVL